MSKFLKSLNLAKETEDYVIKKILDKGVVCSRGDGKSVDIYIYLSKTIKCEIKHDIMAEKTGNIAIEFFNSKINKPSGITSSECDIWFHVIGRLKEVCFTSVELLRKFCRENDPDKIVYRGGDNNSDMMLYKKEKLDSLLIKLDDVEDITKCLMSMLNI